MSRFKVGDILSFEGFSGSEPDYKVLRVYSNSYELKNLRLGNEFSAAKDTVEASYLMLHSLKESPLWEALHEEN